MGGPRKKRSTVYNDFKTSGKWKEVYPKNRQLLEEFLDYMRANDRSPQTILQYESKLSVFFVWNLEHNDNKPFFDIKKREFVKFIGYGRGTLGWSSSHLAGHKSALSSLSKYVETYMDDEYPTFRNVMTNLEPIRIEHVREKTVLTVEQIEKALQELTDAKEYQLACYLSLLFSSGVRKAEALRMQVNFFVDENVVWDLMYKTPKIRTKGRGVKGKQVSRYIFKYEFDPYLKAWLKEREEKGINLPELFVDYRGGEWVPANVTTVNKWAGKLGQLMGVDYYSHCMRHMFVSKLRRQGYPKEILQKLQSWSSTELVDIYDDNSDEEELERFFDEIKGQKELKDE